MIALRHRPEPNSGKMVWCYLLLKNTKDIYENPRKPTWKHKFKQFEETTRISWSAQLLSILSWINHIDRMWFEMKIVKRTNLTCRNEFIILCIGLSQIWSIVGWSSPEHDHGMPWVCHSSNELTYYSPKFSNSLRLIFFTKMLITIVTNHDSRK